MNDIMPNKFFISSSLFALALFINISGEAFAQNCSSPYEMVTELRHPNPGSYSVWNSVYGGDKTDEEFISVVSRGNEVVAIGEVRDIHSLHPSMVFVKFDRRGRKVWEKHHSISGHRNIVKMLAHGEGYIVVANNRRLEYQSSVWIGFFDKDAALKSQKILKDSDVDLIANDIVEASSGNGWALSVSSIIKIGAGKGKKQRMNASVYLLDKNANKVSSRAYILGVNNEITGLSVAKVAGKNSGYIATGSFENKNGNNIGWILKLNDQASYVWQKEFSRGISANMKLSVDSGNGEIFVLGDVLSISGGIRAAWFMALNSANGDMAWQRFYYGDTGKHDYKAKGLYANDDGTYSVMMMAQSKVRASGDVVGDDAVLGMPDDISYAHVLNINKRGVTLMGDAYYMGKGASISQMVKGVAGNRLMAGYAVLPVGGKTNGKSPVSDDIEPLHEESYIDLPDIELSNKAKHGLALLKRKINEREDFAVQNTVESAKTENTLTKYGWVVIGEKPDEYIDPCD